MKAERERSQWFYAACSSGKRAFVARAGAKHAARQVAKSGSPGNRPYQCPECGHWHIGHKPAGVMAGQVAARDVYARRPA